VPHARPERQSGLRGWPARFARGRLPLARRFSAEVVARSALCRPGARLRLVPVTPSAPARGTVLSEAHRVTRSENWALELRAHASLHLYSGHDTTRGLGSWSRLHDPKAGAASPHRASRSRPIGATRAILTMAGHSCDCCVALTLTARSSSLPHSRHSPPDTAPVRPLRARHGHSLRLSPLHCPRRIVAPILRARHPGATMPAPHIPWLGARAVARASARRIRSYNAWLMRGRQRIASATKCTVAWRRPPTGAELTRPRHSSSVAASKASGPWRLRDRAIVDLRRCLGPHCSPPAVSVAPHSTRIIGQTPWRRATSER
jgi:hypothetical protein